MNKKYLPGYNQERYKKRLEKDSKYFQKYIDKRNSDSLKRELYLKKQREYYRNRLSENPNLNKLQYENRKIKLNSNVKLKEIHLLKARELARKSYRKYKWGKISLDNIKRVKVVEELGGKCTSCGYNKDFRALVLDHIKGDGYLDRKRIGNKIYRYYVNNIDEAKNNLQILCANCNMIKSFENNEHNVSRRIKVKEVI